MNVHLQIPLEMPNCRNEMCLLAILVPGVGVGAVGLLVGDRVVPLHDRLQDLELGAGKGCQEVLVVGYVLGCIRWLWASPGHQECVPHERVHMQFAFCDF